MYREERNRRIAPVIHSTARGIGRVELKNRHQLDRSDAQVDQVWNLLNQAGIGARLFGADTRAGMFSEATDVKLIDYCLHERTFERPIPFPVIRGRIGDDTFHRNRVAVSCVSTWHGDGKPIRIQQGLVTVESQSARGVVRSRCAESIRLSWPKTGNEYVPVVIRAMNPRIEFDHARWQFSVRAVEEQQLHQGCVLREYAEIHAPRLDGSAQRSARARTYAWFAHSPSEIS